VQHLVVILCIKLSFFFLLSIGGFYFQIGMIQGGLSECTNKYSGIFVRLDNPKILKFINDEVGQFLPKTPIPEGKSNKI
jgi:hypothetical protein